MVCSEIHTLAAAPLGKNPGAHFQETVRAPKALRSFWRRQYYLALAGSRTPACPTRSLVTVPEFSILALHIYIN
jgi:hypothetical protein